MARAANWASESTGTPSFFLHPAEAIHGDLGIVTPDDIIIAISNSGTSNEIIELLPFFKRFGIKVRGRKHDKKQRHVGVLGPRNVARVLPGKIPYAGQLGFQTRTEYNKKILQLGSGGLNPKGGWLSYGPVKGDFIVLKGSVPGPRKRLIILERPARPPKSGREPVEIKEIVLESQQGV